MLGEEGSLGWASPVAEGEAPQGLGCGSGLGVKARRPCSDRTPGWGLCGLVPLLGKPLAYKGGTVVAPPHPG